METQIHCLSKILQEQIEKVIDQAKKDHGVDLEIDKTYRYCVLSNRKKNYLGVTKRRKSRCQRIKITHTSIYQKFILRIT